ncbi:YopX family protein [Lacticaseibacillus paracasei]|uniref:YopX family protein n=1 Tax=Lacticaseibacillus paracasei TaxID=1597 RepID=UPI0022DFB19F|nr:YopX family protein [Lacticaseibacillus paracasei]
MKREIKFRAYRKSTQNTCNVLLIDFENELVLLSDGDEEDISDVDLMQYTGLHDKNGREIYEGDILHFGSVWCVGDEYDPREEDHIGTVEYRPDYASYVINCNGKIYPLEQVISFDGYSVQGNVHENPELLEGKQ